MDLRDVDATPDGGYALRILEACREECDLTYLSGGAEALDWNERQQQRAAELDKAIAILRVPWSVRDHRAADAPPPESAWEGIPGCESLASFPISVAHEQSSNGPLELVED
jgi:hypothetical protein